MDGKKSTVKKRVVKKRTPIMINKSIDNPVDDPSPTEDFIDEYLDTSTTEEVYPAEDINDLDTSDTEETYPAENIDDSTCSISAFSGNTPVLQENIESKVKPKDGYYKDNFNKFHMM